MIISEKTSNGITVIALEGSLDASSVSRFMSGSPALTDLQTIVIDFAGVDFLDSTGLGSLVGLARRKREGLADVKLACMSEKVRKVFEVTQAFRLFDIYDDVDTAAKTAAKN
jgi:anti-sigma B factor antagonist